jgi:pilus assembly protein CpaB
MNIRTIVLAVAALLVAGVTAMFVRSWLSTGQNNQADAVQAAKPAFSVLVAKTDLPAGAFIKGEDLRWQPWPNDSVDPSYVLEDKGDIKSFAGAVVRRGIAAGEPITPARVAKPGDRGFLAVVLKPGMRAVSVGISATSGIAGLIFPGDRVDIILTQTLPGAGGGLPLRASETVLENVRILALDQKLSDQQQDEPAVLASTATIEVTPKQAEMIAVVTELGRLSLSLRSLATDAEEAVATAGAEADLNAELAQSGEQGTGPTESINVNDIAEPSRGETFTLDNEVSRLIGGSSGAANQTVLVFHGSAQQQVSVGGALGPESPSPDQTGDGGTDAEKMAGLIKAMQDQGLLTAPPAAEAPAQPQ